MTRWIAVTGAVLVMASLARGENWPQWRGPHFNGSTTETGLPDDWSQTENIAWSAELPGPSARHAGRLE